ncbi:FKBP-type peptidyl-prolyl cis-trans isomerase [Mariniflexile sp.]|uniref:FKBP-type peptidyl-prolyl cis-trans isomerase n=1 Tax=Mariniflexile sp. TaxID=1979402 RepID=UPI003569BD4A
MNLRKVSLFILCLVMAVASCKKDEDPEVTFTELEDRAEQQEKDMDSLVKYLETHYYNSEYIESLGVNASVSDIVFGKLEADETDAPEGYTMLKKGDVYAPKLEMKSITYADTDYDYFLLSLNIGGGINSPKFPDKIRYNYEGFTLDDVVFDYSVFPVDGDMVGNGTTRTERIPGWRKIIPFFNTAEYFVENGDGTIDYFNHGLGVMFLPSGLAYFSNSATGIPSYSPIIFKFEILQMFENDHDGDGIPSYLEDLNGDGEFIVNYDDITDSTDDDTDGDYTPDYADSDDDGDGILTKDEITITTVNKTTLNEVKNTSLAYNQVLLNKINKELDGSYTGTIITFHDTDGVGVFDYLDKNH